MNANNPSWKLATVSTSSGQQPALVVDGGLYAIDPGGRPATLSLLGILQEWEAWHPQLASQAVTLVADAQLRTARGLGLDATLKAPILYPRNIFGAGSNYGSHAREMGHEPLDKATVQPFFFIKASSSVIGPDEAIVIPAFSTKVDWEGELAAVIGKRAKNVPLDQAADYVAGYTIMNDVSARDTHRREDWGQGAFYWDWLQSKGCDTFGPMGPYLVPRSQIADPYNLRLTTTVSGVVQQDANTSDLIFNVEEQIAYLSSFVTLEPGDVISTGTPPGVGAPRGLFLKKGDEVVVTIEGIGTLRNPVR